MHYELAHVHSRSKNGVARLAYVGEPEAAPDQVRGRPSSGHALSSPKRESAARAGRAIEAWMLQGFLRTLVKIAVASLIVGTILAHFGITADVLMKQLGLSPERLEEFVRRGITWALPNLLLGLLIIVPLWFLAFIFRPPGRSSE
jgi:hypothetical protein